MKSIYLVIAISLLMVSCSTTVVPVSTYNGQKMSFTKLNGKKVKKPAEEERFPHLIFNSENNTYFLTGGCNRVTGEIKYDDEGAIKFSNGAKTAMACENMEFEDALINTVNEVDGFGKKGKKLVLKKNGEVVAVLKPKS